MQFSINSVPAFPHTAATSAWQPAQLSTPTDFWRFWVPRLGNKLRSTRHVHFRYGKANIATQALYPTPAHIIVIVSRLGNSPTIDTSLHITCPYILGKCCYNNLWLSEEGPVKELKMEALSPRDINAQRPRQNELKSKATAMTKAGKEHPPPPPAEVYEPPSSDRKDGATYTVGKMLGKGGFAVCYDGKLAPTRERYALKIVKSQMPSKMEQKFQTELQIHSKMRNQNIVQFLRAFAFDNCTYLVLELCPNGSLMDMVKRRKGVTEGEVRFYTIQISGAIKYMHSKGVIHRDLKMGNIFLDRHMNAKIGDFGLAALLVTGKDMQTIRRTTLCGTPNYIAPEILQKGRQGHDHMVDIWSLGIILFAMLAGKPPFQSSTTDEIYRRARERDYEWPEPSKKYISPEAKDLVANMLQEADRRPHPDEIVQHKWFSTGYMPTTADMNSNLREFPPENPAFYDDIVTAEEKRKSAHNHQNTCRECQVGPWNRSQASHISTWREVAAEEKAGLTPIIPLAEGIVYRPFNEWVIEQKRAKEQRLAARAALAASQSSKAPRETDDTESLVAPMPNGLMKAPPQSYAAQQRAQHKPVRTMETVLRTKPPSATTSQASASTGTMRSRAKKDTISSTSSATSSRPTETTKAAPVDPESTNTISTLTRPLQSAPRSMRKNTVASRPTESLSRPSSSSQTTRTAASTSSTAASTSRTSSLKRSPSPIDPNAEVATIFGPDEYHERVPTTEPDVVLTRLRHLQAELDRALNSRSMAFVSARTAPPPLPRIVIKWIDYSNKLGHGYILNDGTIGALVKSLPTTDPVSKPTPQVIPPVCLVVHNAENHLVRRAQDPTYADRHQMAPQNESVHYLELQGEKGISRVLVPAKTYWTSEADGAAGRMETGKDVYDYRKRERLIVWRKFANYMMQYGRDGSGKDDPELLPTITDPGLPPNDVVILYQRFGDVGCWVFCDGHMQFNFPDHTKLVLDATGTHCHFWHLPVEAAELLNENGQLDTVALDSRTVLSYPLQTMLNMNRSSAASSGTSRSGRTRPQISPEIRVIPEANDFRHKVEFVRQVVREWVSHGGIGNARTDRDNRIRWLGSREAFGITAPQKHVWVSVGARWGDQSVSCFVDPRYPSELGQEIDFAKVRSGSSRK
ncbi:uncharacterized protein MKZ38_002411 [Zalerion maritima]|uniref:Protein kinase domain-containing protein n=1 Tax=Zalerion maritima TaxID=339359 RepID=A0AAD5WQU8_9PEZI|nr:uncharacterized protein MKZ38_002411 [Zalerion maritima]